jgi:hypothetical protein
LLQVDKVGYYDRRISKVSALYKWWKVEEREKVAEKRDGDGRKMTAE